jgi:CheY-like chemotaxis protein
MGGELTVQSTPGKGSLFELRIYLPEVISPKTTARTEVDIVGYRGPRKRLLILDDEPSQRALLTTMLGPLGFEITQAASGEECLRLAALLQPDAFLLDVTMPGIDGWEVCRLLRVQGFERTPVIMVSASAFENDPARRMHTRADDFIVKPVLVSELLAKLNTQLKLDWIHNGEQLDPQAIRRPQRADLDLPPVEQIDELLELGAIGYVKGIKQKLDEIDRLDPRYEPFTGELRTFVNRFRLAEYSDWIKEVTSHEPRNP